MCLGQSPLFQHFFTPGWFSPLLHCPSVPPPLPVFLTFLVQFPFLHPGVLTAAQMKTPGSSSSVWEVWGAESFCLVYRWAAIRSIYPEHPDSPELKYGFKWEYLSLRVAVLSRLISVWVGEPNNNLSWASRNFCHWRYKTGWVHKTEDLTKCVRTRRSRIQKVDPFSPSNDIDFEGKMGEFLKQRECWLTNNNIGYVWMFSRHNQRIWHCCLGNDIGTIIYTRGVQAQSSRVTIQPDFLSHQLANTFTWDPTFLGKTPFLAFLPGSTESPAGSKPSSVSKKCVSLCDRHIHPSSKHITVFFLACSVRKCACVLNSGKVCWK